MDGVSDPWLAESLGRAGFPDKTKTGEEVLQAGTNILGGRQVQGGTNRNEGLG